jgi:hypothetical protein
MALTIDDNVPITETRGRPPSEEHVKLWTMRIGQSFVSTKRRETLYQIARSMGVKVRIMSEGKDGWRVWKKSIPMPREERIAKAKLARARAKAHRRHKTKDPS